MDSTRRSAVTSELEQYDYDLPKQLIAQEPLANRSDARLMIVDRRRGAISHHHVRDLPELLRRGDQLVLNDTKVIPARLVGLRDTGGRWEGLFLSQEPSGAWQLLCKARGKLTAGETIQLLDPLARGYAIAPGRQVGAGGLAGPAGFGRTPHENLGAHRPRAAAQIHSQRRNGRSGPTALSNRFRAAQRIGGRAHRGLAFHRRATGPLASRRNRRRESYPARRDWIHSLRSARKSWRPTKCTANGDASTTPRWNN